MTVTKQGSATFAPQLLSTLGGVEEVQPRMAGGSGPIDPIREVHLDTDDVAQIVHDMRAPLATMTLDAFLMETKLQRGDHAGLLTAFRRNRYNISFLERLVEDLLDLCALDSQHFELRRTRNDLFALLEQIVERVVPACDRPRVCLQGAPLSISIDELRIQRAVSNLLANALRYASRGEVIVRLTRTKTIACISVIDAGPGLSHDDMAVAFDKYRRCSSSKNCGGAGLGLYICKQIVTAHGGHVGVESELGVGSRFFIELPLAVE